MANSAINESFFNIFNENINNNNKEAVKQQIATSPDEFKWVIENKLFNMDISKVISNADSNQRSNIIKIINFIENLRIPNVDVVDKCPICLDSFGNSNESKG